MRTFSESTPKNSTDSPTPPRQTQVLARNLEMIIRIADIQNLLTGEDHKKTQPVHDTSNANTQRKNKPSLMRALRSVGVRPFKDFKIKPL